jgi:lipoyl-dependent peroxiredoxin
LENTNLIIDDIVLYTAKTHTVGGRDGHATSSDNRLDIALSLPGTTGNGTNPEQLFAAGWSACFTGAMARAATKLGIHLPVDTSVAAEVDLMINDDDEYSLQARLNANLPGIDLALAQAIVDHAHQLCPYSRATRGNIKVVVKAI